MSDRKGEAFNIIKAINEVSLLVSICNKGEGLIFQTGNVPDLDMAFKKKKIYIYIYVF